MFFWVYNVRQVDTEYIKPHIPVCVVLRNQHIHMCIAMGTPTCIYIHMYIHVNTCTYMYIHTHMYVLS